MEALVAAPPDIGLLWDVADVLLGAIASPAWTSDGGGSGSSNSSEKHNDVVAKTSLSRGEKRGNGNTEGGRGENSSNSGGGSCSSSRSCSNHVGSCNTGSAWFARFVPLVLEAFPVRALEGEMLGDGEAEQRLSAIEALNMRLCELVVAACTGRAALGATETGAADDSCDAADWLQPILAHVHEVLRDGVGKGRAGAQVPSVLRVVSAAMYNPSGGDGESGSWTEQR